MVSIYIVEFIKDTISTLSIKRKYKFTKQNKVMDFLQRAKQKK